MLTPGQNPSEGSDNPENALYAEWLADEQSRQLIETRMLPALRRHAHKVCWMVLHCYDPAVVENICVDALMALPTFEGRSQFSTWFHGFALNVLRAEYRRRTRRREVSMDSGAFPMDTPSSSQSSPERSVSMQEFVARLASEEQELIRLKVFEGYSDYEISVLLGQPRESVTRDWIKLRRKMRVLYAGKAA